MIIVISYLAPMTSNVLLRTLAIQWITIFGSAPRDLEIMGSYL